MAEEKAMVSGPTAIVTGANTGIGFHVAGHLAAKGYNVILACRSKDKGEQAVKDLKGQYGGKSQVSCELLDLSSLASTQAFAAAFAEKHTELKLLVCNGGVSPSAVPQEADKQLSADGVDLLYQTNYLSHFYLTLALLPLLQAGKGRVTIMTSAMHRNSKPAELDLSMKVREPYVALYGFSKLVQLVQAFEMHRRFGSGDKAVAFHTVNPGGVASDIWRAYPVWKQKLFGCTFNTAEKAAVTVVKASVCEEGLAPAAPKYWNGYKCAGLAKTLEYWSPLAAGETLVETVPSDDARDPAFGKKLFEHSIAAIQAAGFEISADGEVTL